MTRVACEVCGKQPHDGTTLYRTGLKGPRHDPHWRCEVHLNGAVVPVDVTALVAIIERGSADKLAH